jgi:hypothetical protein
MSKGRAIKKGEMKLLALLGELPEGLISALRTDVISKHFNVSEEEDQSGFGADMEWMTPQEQVEEATEYYPGMAAIKNRYFPIGKCMMGSGNPYFVKEAEDGTVNVYRIPHEAIDEDDKLDESQVELVCTLSDLLKKN